MPERAANCKTGPVKLIALTLAHPLIVVAALLSFCGAIHQASAAQRATDPSLRLTIRTTNQSVVLNWFGANAVPYQLESSSNLAAWINSGPVITGSGASLFITNSTAEQRRAFYRVSRVIPAAADSAVFNPATGLLTIVGDDLDNTIFVTRDGAGTIVVSNDTVPMAITGESDDAQAGIVSQG